MKHIVILISGTGSNMAAIVRAAQQQHWAEPPPRGLGARVAAVISNRPQAGGLEFARQAGIATGVVDHRAFASREAVDAERPCRARSQARPCAGADRPGRSPVRADPRASGPP